MSALRDAARQALEALELCGLTDTHRSYEVEHAARTALRAALAQEEKEQEPVVWDASAPLVMTPHPAFAHPPRREWRSLSDEEIDVIQWHGSPFQFARAIEAALKEKNHG